MESSGEGPNVVVESVMSALDALDDHTRLEAIAACLTATTSRLQPEHFDDQSLVELLGRCTASEAPSMPQSSTSLPRLIAAPPPSLARGSALPGILPIHGDNGAPPQTRALRTLAPLIDFPTLPQRSDRAL